MILSSKVSYHLIHVCSWEHDFLSSRLLPDAFMQWLLRSVPLHHLIKCWHSSLLGIPGSYQPVPASGRFHFSIKQILQLLSLHFQFLKVDPLHIISLPSTYSGFLRESEHMHTRLTGNSGLSVGVSANGCFSMWPCDEPVFKSVTQRNLGVVNASEVVSDGEH